MKQENLIREQVIKVVNSRLRIEVKRDVFCDNELRAELGATEKDMNAISSMLEKLFKILIEDEEIIEVKNVNDIIQTVMQKGAETNGNLAMKNT